MINCVMLLYNNTGGVMLCYGVSAPQREKGQTSYLKFLVFLITLLSHLLFMTLFAPVMHYIFISVFFLLLSHPIAHFKKWSNKWANESFSLLSFQSEMTRSKTNLLSVCLVWS